MSKKAGIIKPEPEDPPSTADLRDVYNLDLQAADGHPVRFGDLCRKGEITNVVVFSTFFAPYTWK